MRLMHRLLLAAALLAAPLPAYAGCSLGTPSPANNIAISATGTTGALTASLLSTSSSVTNMTGFYVSGSGATTAIVLDVTVTGSVGGTLHFSYGVSGTTTAANTPLNITFACPLQAAAANTAIVVNVPAAGTGSVIQSVTAFGY
jgi:hypothetical protein